MLRLSGGCTRSVLSSVAEDQLPGVGQLSIQHWDLADILHGLGLLLSKSRGAVAGSGAVCPEQARGSPGWKPGLARTAGPEGRAPGPRGPGLRWAVRGAAQHGGAASFLRAWY